MPADPLETIPKNEFWEIANFLPTAELLDLRQTSKTMEALVDTYLEDLTWRGRILDPGESFTPVDKETDVDAVVTGLARRNLVRELLPVAKDMAIDVWDRTIQTVLRNEEPPYLDPKQSPDVLVVARMYRTLESLSPPTDPDTMDGELQLRQEIHYYIEYCIDSKLLIDYASGDAITETDIDMVFVRWALGSIRYDRSRLK